MIREVRYTDKSAIIKLVKEFFDEELNDRGVEFNENAVAEDFDRLFCSEYVVHLCIEYDGFIDGVMCGVIAKRPFFGDVTCQELIWYVRPHRRKDGIEMLKTFEYICKNSGCNSISMIALSDSKAEKIYDRLGYTKHESCFMKRLEHIGG